MHWFSYSPLIPPSLFIMLAPIAVALAWRRRWRRAGLVLTTIAVTCLYLCATPLAGFLLTRAADRLARIIPTLPPSGPPGAIVVLSAGFRHGSGPGGRDSIDRLTLGRLAAAVAVAHRTGLPILVSGGWLAGADNSMAGMMAETLSDDFREPARWREARSRTTYENALYSAAILRRAGIRSALVVTDPWHMARTLWSFYAVGYPVVAAPIPGRAALPLSPKLVLPDVPALAASYYALHELIGLTWYVARYRPS